ncbi:MAG: hypothetical protein LBC68_15325 [Prevotellaceae bacterium]|jgi:hypothetical protein|nr:hypothetical protein [Prevotellaceae bacterium]
MKKIIKTLNLAAIMLMLAGVVSSCGKEENETEKQIDFTEFAINESNCGWQNLNYDNKVIIINSMQDLGNYVNCRDGDLTEVDFSKNTLLLVSGINAGGVADVDATLLTKVAGKDEYVLDIIVYKNDAAIAGENWQLAVLTPKISDAATVSLNKDEVTEIDFQEYSLAENCQWKNLNYDNKVIVINSMSDLANYIDCAEGGLSEIDFNKHTLLLAHGTATSGIGKIITSFYQNYNHQYTLNIEVSLGITAIMQPWAIGIVVPKLPENAQINLQVQLIQPF